MKNLILNTKLFLMALVAVFALSCSGEDGNDGAPGEKEPAGTDGANGNANVSFLTYDISSVNGTYHDQFVPEITANVLENDVILGYVVPSNNTSLPLPAIGDYLDFSIAVFISSENYSLDFVDRFDGSSYNINAGDLNELKVVIIESTSNTSGRSATSGSTSKENIVLELKNANVDISDYDAVLTYYGLTNK